jgi:CelD/BcsL family acetyltransferase involved in cellulose biosynthesis
MSALANVIFSKPIHVVPVEDHAGFVALEREWNALVVSHNNQLFLRHEFLRVWLESFAPEARLRVLTGRDDEGRLVAVLPLMMEASSLSGLPVRQAVSLANPHSCQFDMVAADPVAAGQAFLEHLAGRNDWDLLRVIDVPEGGQAWELQRAARAAGFPVGAWESQRSPYLGLPAGDDALSACVSAQARANVRRRRRQMDKQALVKVERLQSGDVRQALDEFFAVERSGWKGRQGTACVQDERTRTFYMRLADIAVERQWLSFFRLVLGDRTIAFHFGLVYGGRYLLPKLGYDEEFRDLSPGLVLMYEAISDCVSRQLSSVEFLGSDDEWKLRWSRTVRQHHWLYVFRNDIRGRLMQRAKFVWGPWVKRGVALLPLWITHAGTALEG